jgi:pimeloyl-ACP methyl ester carboxylesterase
MADVQVRRLRFHVQRFGRGRSTVVFLHGLIMDNLSSFYFTLAPRVADFADVVLYDLRGHGHSERPTSGYALSDMVEDLSELLYGIDIRHPVYLIGHSFGGLVAQAFAFSYPSRVSGMVLVDTLSPDEGWGERMAQTLRLDIGERYRQIAERFRDWGGRHSPRKSARLAEVAEALVSGTSLVDELRTSAYLKDSELATIGCPTLMLCGEQSDMRESGERLARLLPNSELRILPACTHSLLWEATGVASRHVVDWLRLQE